MIRPLEARFSIIELDGPGAIAPNQRPHFAVVLGGAVQPLLSDDAARIAVNGAAERLLETARLAKQEQELAILISGGAGTLWSGAPEAPLIRDWLVAQGIPDKRLILEDKSRNTFENAERSLAIIKRAIPDDQPLRLAIITSAAHMPRAMGSFRRAARDAGLANIEPMAYPVDFRSAPVPLLRIQRVGNGLANLDAASREWFALLAYFLLERIDSPLPGPTLPGPTITEQTGHTYGPAPAPASAQSAEGTQ
ncbi:MAG: YdcF family protein [Pseudomonadota bacterium]